jgi:hypothetical protein
MSPDVTGCKLSEEEVGRCGVLLPTTYNQYQAILEAAIILTITTGDEWDENKAKHDEIAGKLFEIKLAWEACMEDESQSVLLWDDETGDVERVLR